MVVNLRKAASHQFCRKCLKGEGSNSASRIEVIYTLHVLTSVVFSRTREVLQAQLIFNCQKQGATWREKLFGALKKLQVGIGRLRIQCRVFKHPHNNHEVKQKISLECGEIFGDD